MLQACERNYYPSCLNLGLLGRAWLFYVNVSFNMMQKVFWLIDYFPETFYDEHLLVVISRLTLDFEYMIVSQPGHSGIGQHICSFSMETVNTLSFLSGAFLTSGSRSGMNILDHISESLEQYFRLKLLQFFDADSGSGSEIFLTLDGIRDGKIRIRDKHPGSATLDPIRSYQELLG